MSSKRSLTVALAIAAVLGLPASVRSQSDAAETLSGVLKVKAFLNGEKYQLSGDEFWYAIYKNGEKVGKTRNPATGESYAFLSYGEGDTAGLCEISHSKEVNGFVLQGHENGCYFQTMTDSTPPFVFVYKKYVPIQPYISITGLWSETVRPGTIENSIVALSGDRVDKSATKLVKRNRPRMLRLLKPRISSTSPYTTNPTTNLDLVDFGAAHAPTWFRGPLHDSLNFREIRMAWKIPWRAKHLRRGARICFTVGVKARGSTLHADTGVEDPWLSDVKNESFCFRKAGKRR